MKPTISAFKQSPDRGRGLARDFRVRWALEEVGQAYDVQLVTFPEMKEAAYRELNPFGQIPTYRDGEVVLFESGSILMRIAEIHKGLLPEEKNARARAITWMFASLSTVEPPIVDLTSTMLFEKDKPWQEERVAALKTSVRKRLGELSQHLGESDWLDGSFSAADILMVHVIRRLESTGLLNEYANLAAYVERAKARPAYQRAFEAQLKVYNDSLSAKS